MKQIIFKSLIVRTLAFVMLMMCAVPASAQYYMNLFQNDGKKYQFVLSDIDSVRITDIKQTDTPEANPNVPDTGLYLGIIGFNQELYTHSLSLLTENSKSSFDGFIDDLEMKSGTLLCYAVENALSTLNRLEMPSNLSTVAIVTFTDGLDQGSLMMTDKFYSDEDYLSSLQQTISSSTYSDVSLSSYSIGLRGQDVSNLSKFQSTLKQLAYPEKNAYEVSNMSGVNTTFQEIAGQLNSRINYQTVTLKMPGISDGTRIRFTFDNVTSATLSQTYIEGTFNLKTRSLSDVEYIGMSSSSGEYISGVTEGIFITFTFEGIQTTDNRMLSKEHIREWYQTSSSGWQINSEFDPSQQPDIEIQRSSAVILLVLDCSSSLGSQFSNVKTHAKSFINTICNSFDETYIPTSLTITFNSNGGSGYMQSMIIWPDEQNKAIKLSSSTFTRDGYEFIGWNTKADGTGISYSDGQEISVKENITLYAQWKEIPTHNGYEYVDLGLPSGLKWATCNIGAESPEGYGSYFAWGETNPKSDYEWETYKFRTSGDSYDNVKFSKYNTDSDYGPIDNKTTLDLSDDAARANWGGFWRMPTRAEQDELREKCTWTWTTLNGIKGYKVTSKSNGNSIFLPAAGERNGTGVGFAGTYGYYWSSSLNSDFPRRADFLRFYSGGLDWNSGSARECGLPVRAVCLDTENIPTSYTISFNANGGEGEMSSFEIWSDETNTINILSSTFTRDGYEFIGWNTKADGTGISYSDGQEISVKENITLYAQWKEIPTHNGYEYVDLGLPSGLKWATCNVGASSPEGYGSYFAWGETSSKSDYDWDTYKYCRGSWDELTKYCDDSDRGYNGYTDNKATLDLIDDAARVNWGGSWRMPTYNEWDELRTQCTWKWITQNAVNGYKVTSKINGNSIFLPAAGYRGGTDVGLAGSYGNYWSSSLYSDDPAYAYFQNFHSGYVYWNGIGRYCGLTVRAVCLDTENIPTSYTISFNANGGEGDMANIEFVKGETVTVSINTFTRVGYKFIGWNTKADGSGTSYGSEQSITVAENLVLYAQWELSQIEATQVTISFVANGGVGEMSQIVTSAENLILPVNAFTYDGYEFIGWNTKADGTGSSYSDGQEISVKENITLYAQWRNLSELSGTHNGYEYVDLGLSVKWATCNVGASSPEGYGSYFAWGETEPKSNYSWSTYKHCNNGSPSELIKYNVDSSWGTVDNITTLELEDDAAHVNWGGSWRMPTYGELNELKTNCTWTWTTLNGVKGYKVVSKSNGNSIFLPAAGYRIGTDVSRAGSYGDYWSSSLTSYEPLYAYGLSFDSGNMNRYSGNFRFCGRPVRAVCLDTEHIPTSYTISFNANGGEGEMSLFEIWSDETPTVPICTFTRDGYEFIGWNTKADGSGTSYSNEQSITVAENLVLYAQWKEIPKITHNGYEYVDLGLPSGLKWATCNVGAESPEDYGDYFAWGETSPKSDYEWETYKFRTSGYNYGNVKFNKYNTDSYFGPIDTKTTLDLNDDAARVNWGGSWRMPTRAEQDELREKCTWTWTTLNGIKGYKVTSKSNGNSIFLPAAGYRGGTSVYDAGSIGFYWSSSLYSDYPYRAYYLYFNSDFVDWLNSDRFLGHTVRAVCLDTENIPTSYTISFNANGGVGEMSLFAIWSDETPTLPICTFTRDGYEFIGWNTKADGTGSSYSDGQEISVKENITLYAQWELSQIEATQVTISFDANGGEGEMSSFEIWSDETLTLPKCTFTCNGYVLAGWNTMSDGSGISYSIGQEISVKESITLYAQWKVCSTHNGYEYVDLGLPSGLKWATMNVGAESPEDYGDYFAWGETSPKSDYDWDTYKFRTSGDSYYNLKFSKYNTESDYSPIDNKTVLDLSDDVARVNWGGSWRMPTYGELDELKTNCTWTWTTLNGITGYIVTSKSKGNSIFLPAAGYRDGTDVYPAGSYGNYWSSSLCSGRPYDAYCLPFDSGNVYWGYGGSRYYGHAVRAVCLDTENIPTSYTISFNANGGEGEMSSFEIWSDETNTINILSSTFTRDGYEFIGWNTKADGTGASYSDGQEISVKENITLYAQWRNLYESSCTHNGYEYVDLGLPSGLMWATMNVGAESPEDYGDYFAWGETTSKSNYTWETYKFRTSGDSYDNVKFSKYNTDSDYGPIDNKTVLDLSDDAARVNWGGSWRMPTRSELDELIDECLWDWTTLNGVSGVKIISKTNGKSIFFPAVGYLNGTDVSSAGSYGFYWSSSLDLANSCYASYLIFYDNFIRRYLECCDRFTGRPVRAVCSEIENIPAKNMISFNANGGEGKRAPLNLYSEETIILPINTFIRDGYEFVGWNTMSDGSGISYSIGQEISITKSITLYAQWKVYSTHNGYEYVDLGLPSGLKWAICNVGAESPEDYGDYFAWGETSPKSDYDWDTYKFRTSGDSYYNLKFSKYNTDSDLDLSDDVARANWGGSWRMPTSDELYELKTKCTWTWATMNGVKGYKVTGPSGNSIFLPAAGFRYGTGVYDVGAYGSYWSSSLSSSYQYSAYNLRLYSDGVNHGDYDRCRGNSVRAVCLDTENIPTSYTISFNANGGEGEMSSFEIWSDETITLQICTFTCNGYVFAGWNTMSDGSGISYSIGQEISITKSITLYAQWKVCSTHNGYEYVDLGLPSGLKWATCNVGAESPEDYGDYFAWGETSSKSYYSWETYKYSRGSYEELTKYCTDGYCGYNGFTDIKTVLDLSDDAARVNWGGSWRMPTKEECDELRQECNWSIINIYGVSGYKVTSKTNGNSIFLPLSGYYDEFGINRHNLSGDYWSIQLDLQYSTNAYYMSFNSDEVTGYNHSRYYGRSVRAVCLDTENTPTSYTISFNANGGEGEMSSFEIWSDETNTINILSSTFTRDGYEFIGWNTKADGTGSSYSDGQEISVKENITLYAQWKEIPTHNGYEYVDLGLPSGLKWATCNIGAESPEGYGSYFAWGETSPKSDYEWETYKFRTSGNDLDNVKFSKYNTDSYYGPIDTKTTLDLIDDAARVNWGGSWRMPTYDELNELKTNCTWTWSTLNGVKGYKVTSTSNGNSIFLPAAGFRERMYVDYAGSEGDIWSSSLDSSDPYYAYCLYFVSDLVGCYPDGRYCGRSVRAVCLDTENIPTSYTISFNANGGEGVMSSLEIWSDETQTLPICTFTRDGYELFIGWNTSADGTGSSYSDGQEISVKENITLYAQWSNLSELSGTHNGYEYVDLGLPSGLKWATCNVGAYSPETYGSYFAWGETESKSNYSWSTYKHCNNGSFYELTKYNVDSGLGTVDNITTLELEDDAAHVNWGGSWRMPTYGELDELKTNCTWTWTTLNGITGYKVTSKSKGNSIFLPAAGYRYGTDVYSAGSYGSCWSSSLDSDGPDGVYYLNFNSGYVGWSYYDRVSGRTVRAVCP